MKKATVSVSGSIELFYDETEIQTTLEEYRECMDKDASLEDMLSHVLFYLNRFGSDRMVEGVGYIGLRNYAGDKVRYEGEPKSGIERNASDVDDEFDFYVESTVDA